MKYLLILITLMVTTINHAQTETETKRPSWSQGLPERNNDSLPGNPSFKPDSGNTTIAAPETSEHRPSAPEFDLNIVTQPDLNFNIETEAPPLPDIQPTRKTGLSQYQDREMIVKDTNPLHEKYHWATIKTTPIDIPANFATKNLLKVRIHINPKGEVIKVAAGAPDVPALMLKQAQQSIQSWLFEPPKDIGITDNMAKTFTIEIKTS